nr:hypothetical protein [Mesorhizobium sp. LSJC255A00]
MLDIFMTDDPGRTLAILLGLQIAGADHAQHGHWPQAELRSRFLQCILAALRPFVLFVDGDVVLVAESADTGLRPIPTTRGFAEPVEKRCDRSIRQLACQGTDQVLDVRRGAPTVMACFVLPDRKRGMVAALPMHQHFDVVVFDGDDNLADHGTDDPLARGGGGVGMMPCQFEIGAHAQQAPPFLLSQSLRLVAVERVKLVLTLADGYERGIPASLQFACYKPVVRVDGVILAACMGGFMTCLLECELHMAPLLSSLHGGGLDGP